MEVDGEIFPKVPPGFSAARGVTLLRVDDDDLVEEDGPLKSKSTTKLTFYSLRENAIKSDPLRLSPPPATPLPRVSPLSSLPPATPLPQSGRRSGRSRTGSTPSTRDATETTSTLHAASQASEPSVEHTPGTESSSTNRRGRGPTRGLVLERLTREGRVTVEFPQDCLRPIGDNARLFTSDVGVLCRSLIPATTPRWTDVTDDVRQLIRQRLQDKFVLDLSVPYISHAVDDMVRERFKEYRGELHQRYKRCRTHDEAVLSALLHVTIDNWRILCERFSSEAFQKRSRINSTNREKLEVNHVAGSKSFVRHRYDMRDSVTGQEPGPVDLYRGTHCRQATESWVHPRASENWAAMDIIRSQPTLDGSQRSELDILSEVLGTRSGYVRGLGHGAKLMAPARPTSSRSVAGERALHRADIAEREVQQLRVIVDEIREQLERQREENERRQEKQERRIEEMRVEHERQMQEMFQALVARLATDTSPLPPSSDAPPLRLHLRDFF
ncbi:uncharacterized protein LOC131250675 [Magnolia sinica]|uniref:uncharacterized protein LOC131250675 n=1 Tax=Magnolia sinica TaxID=86752 RepID=UPI0026588BE6|nr:uncharacterized protein LOC131250675 [Magnolia sinica]